MHIDPKTLAISRLAEADTASDALLAGWPVEPIGEGAAVTEALVRTYRARAGAIAGRGDAWKRLAASTAELAGNLAKSVGMPARWCRIVGPKGEAFLCCRAADGAYIGCLLVHESSAEVELNP